MNILFLTMGRLDSIETHSIYADLLRCFCNKGHKVFSISPHEKKSGGDSEIVNEKNACLLHVKTGNVTGSKNLIKKGFAQLAIEPIYINAIKKHFSGIKFDLILYSTPPISFCRVVDYVKKRDGAKSYLLLKDIFPQNAVDLEMMKEKGPKAFIYRYFREKEKRLYRISDHIGCMSEANVNYILEHNKGISNDKLSICPNSIEVTDKSIDLETREKIRKKYCISDNKKVFVYGGNLGRPQGIPFLIECLINCSELEDVLFLIIGNGTEYYRLEEYAKRTEQKNVCLMNYLPKDDYDLLVAACDVGMIFLDHRFTIPNFPSRILSYMQAKIPVLAVTDPNTDVGKLAVGAQFGWWCESNDAEAFRAIVQRIAHSELRQYKENAFIFLKNNYDVNNACEDILRWACEQ